MAGDWMKIELELPDKPEVHYIAGALGLDPDAVVGKLMRVWAWFDKHTTDGNALGVTYSLVDRITSVAGFGEAMAFAGWLDQQDKRLVMPGFDKHTSKSAKERALTAKRVAKLRNGDVTPAPLAREEKRKEEKKEKPARKRAPLPTIDLQTFIADCKAKGEKPIPDDDPIFAYAERVGLPRDYLALAWGWFKAKRGAPGRRQKDWRAHFRDAVEGNWPKYWYATPEGGWALTTAGQQAARAQA